MEMFGKQQWYLNNKYSYASMKLNNILKNFLRIMKY